nr:1-(5-phosphoribosyl)-5-((5-phosphoribosylamino)methylideneamino)imidazole-4-carboxamide isomerase [Chloroflexia bacterium]
MIVYPAIDIRDGRCVRLVEGDFGRETVFFDDPAAAARRWHAAGATWLHVVDLDAARSGAPVNVDAVRRIRAAVPIPIQYGGGLRTLADVETMIAAGIDRAVLG